jgi:Tfp pilus assembly protein PilE
MANQGSVRMTTAQLRAMISGGATRDQLPTKASGQSVSSTNESANAAYLAAVNRARVTAEFRAAQHQTARQAAQERTAQMQSVADNSTNLPNFDSQNQIYNSSRNNVVNPSSLFTNQSVNVQGTSRNSTLKYGINTNANFNTATAMNDFTSANPNSEINLGKTVNPAYYTAGLSSVPYNNETNTDLLGGDIQHQETDVNTNLEYEKSLSQQSQSNVNWAQNLSIGSSLIPLAAIGALYFMGNKK